MTQARSKARISPARDRQVFTIAIDSPYGHIKADAEGQAEWQAEARRETFQLSFLKG